MFVGVVVVVGVLEVVVVVLFLSFVVVFCVLLLFLSLLMKVDGSVNVDEKIVHTHMGENKHAPTY